MNQFRSNPAEIYESYFVPAMFRPWASILLGHAAIGTGERVLDVACGTGVVARLAAPLVGTGGHVSAIDMNPAMVEVGRSLPAPSGAGIAWQDGDAAELPFRDDTFDVVLCQHALPFFPDQLAAVREMNRVLVPGGRAVVMVLQGLEQHAVFRALMESVARHLEVPISVVQIPFALCEVAELQTLFADGGFEEVEIRPASITVRFPSPEKFVPLAVMSSSAAVPAFARLNENTRAEIIESIRLEIEPTIQTYRREGFVMFPMFANVAYAKA